MDRVGGTVKGFEGVIIEPVLFERLGIEVYKSATFIGISVKQNHVVAIADEKTVGIVFSDNRLVDVVKHYVCNEQR